MTRFPVCVGKADGPGASKGRPRHPMTPARPLSMVTIPAPTRACDGSETMAPVFRLTPDAGSDRRIERTDSSGRTGRANPDRATQDAWVTRLKAGDEGALCEVIEAFSERLTSVVSGLMADRDAVDDVVAETFTKAFFRIKNFHGEAGLYTWLYRVAINATKDHGKKKRRRPALALDDVPAGAGSIPSREDGPSVERIEDRELRTAVRAAIQELPSKFRSVLVLRELEGLRYDEIAAILDISQGTVESRLFRARRRLQVKLARWNAESAP